jgi:hypothetical protein
MREKIIEVTVPGQESEMSYICDSKYMRVVEILLMLIWGGWREYNIKSTTFCHFTLVTNVALIKHTYNFLYILTARHFLLKCLYQARKVRYHVGKRWFIVILIF